MNHDNHDADHGSLPPDLHARLAALRRDVAPQRDLWPAIATQLARPPATARGGHARARARHRGPARLVPYAIAASLLVAVAVAWQLAPRPAPQTAQAALAATADAAEDPPLLRVADAMTREYLGALRELDAARATTMVPDAAGGVAAELDRSAGEVRAALERDPDAVFLVQRLQRIYAQRLSLARRLA
ncbi:MULTISPECIES: hypothetical protein [unclassified Luteimonas]|uniref:hypothetical protein n=1 Tax=unclassified Luteimonas TaxID=2629088 RepID=UPI0016036D56|nr:MULTISPECIES: hypothetical protein [unclassified Luteimonas]MBB1472287.1 hypothetical protein [Luteimonas sp. MC1782]MBB6598997.1 hypothetical protein [Luteimonas sp. MC1825]QOC89135.1 hypothetical protein IDM46_05260 [Luteimonas sp. MC1825]